MHHYPNPSGRRKLLVIAILIHAFLCRLLGADATFIEVGNFPEPPHRTDINPALLYWEALLLNSFRPQSEHDYLTTNEWNGKKLDDQFRAFASSPNGAFRIIEQAAHQKAPCDWGYDLTYGPTLLLPSLAKVKQLVLLERHRFRLHLESGDVKVGIEEWLATETMAHQVSRDGTLISCLVQETLIAAWRSLDRFDGSCRFSTWLCGILFNRARSLYRRHWWRDAARFLPFVGTDDTTLETSVESPVPTDDDEFADRMPQLMKNLARLSPKHREVVELRFFAGNHWWILPPLRQILSGRSNPDFTTPSNAFAR